MNKTTGGAMYKVNIDTTTIKLSHLNGEVSLSFKDTKGDSYELVKTEKIKVTNYFFFNYYAIIFHIKNIGNTGINPGVQTFKEKFTESKKVRIYYWNDNINDSLKDVMDCFKRALKVHNYDNKVSIGNFAINSHCSYATLTTPRQGGNGGVLSII